MGVIAGILGGVVAGGASAGIGAATAPKTYGPRASARYGAQGALQGYRLTSPQSYALNQVYQPAYLGLGGQNLESLLFGSPGGQQTRNLLSPSGRPLSFSESVPGSSGLLDILGRSGQRIQDIYQQGAERGVESNLGLLNRSLPEAMAFRDATNPQLAALRGRLGDTANEQLSLGGRLDPSTLARITQAVRGNWAQRGLGTSAPAQLDEAVRLQLEGENLNQTRTATAGNIFNSLSGSEPDWSKFILGLGGNPVGDAMQLATGQQPLAYQRWFDPFNPTAGQLSQTGINNTTLAGMNQQNMYAGAAMGGANFGAALAKYYADRNSPQG